MLFTNESIAIKATKGTLKIQKKLALGIEIRFKSDYLSFSFLTHFYLRIYS